MLVCRLDRVIAAIAIVAPASLSFASGELTTVCSTGPAPGVEDANIVGFTDPTIDRDGVIGIVATAVGPGAGEFGVAEGLWFVEDGELTLAVPPGLAAPGVEGASISGIQWYRRTDRGLTLYARLRGEGLQFPNDRIMWEITDEGYTKLIRNGEEAFGFADARYQTVSPPSIDAAGNHVSAVTVEGPGINGLNNQLILRLSRDGEHRILLRNGGPAPGIEGSTLTTLTMYDTADRNGNIPVGGFFTGAGIDGSNGEAIWSLSVEGGDAELIARRGDVAPGGFGSTYAELDGAVSNVSGATLFRAELGLARGVMPQSGIWVHSPLFTRRVVLTQGGPPGAPGADGASFSFLLSPGIGSRGNVAFRGILEGGDPNDGALQGLWTETARGLRLAVRGGDAVPGSPGVVFDRMGNFAMNGSGLLVFGASVQGEGVGPTQGLYAWQPSGEIIELARRGERVAVDGELSASTIADVRFVSGSSGADGRQSALNDDAELVFAVRFEDGSSKILHAQLSNARGPDLDESGRVDMQDLNVVLMNFGFGAGGDTNDDGVTDLRDLNVVLGAMSLRFKT